MNVEKKLCLFCSFVLITIILITGCIGQEKTVTKAMTISNPEEYFPASGTWLYRIDSGETNPLIYRVTEKNQIINILRSPISLEKSEKYYLRLTSVTHIRMADDSEEISFLKITRDDLGIFNDADYIKWTVSKEYDFKVDQVVYYSKGDSTKSIFFLPPYGEQGTIANYMVGKEETMTYIMPDNKPPGCQETCMYFIREVKAGSGAHGYADKGFTEDQWFAKGKGLILLKQEVEGKPSMTWTLEKYTPA